MILLTGGAGFIGSNLHAALAARGHETIIVDRLRQGGKWRNLRHHPPARLIPPDQLDGLLAEDPAVDIVFHLGAVSETTARDGDLVWETNVELSLRLWRWCAQRGVRLVYASSGATYGDGEAGFDDDNQVQALSRLRPLNLYGWTKHAFDLHVAKQAEAGAKLPPQSVGLKFFNVFGPNEYHKGDMVSVVKVKYDEVAGGRAARLFRSDRQGVADGAQARDFIWVGDVVDVMVWLLDHPWVSGLFNLGTGQARTYRDLARAVCAAAGQPERIEFVDMPADLNGQYQAFTQAPMERLRAAGYAAPFTTLEAGVERYVREHLMRPDPYV